MAEAMNLLGETPSEAIGRLQLERARLRAQLAGAEARATEDLQLAKEWEARCASYQAEVSELEQRAQAAEAQRVQLANALQEISTLAQVVTNSGHNAKRIWQMRDLANNALARLDEIREKS